MKTNIDRFLDHQGCFVLDGALATELERRGSQLNDTLWSARILVENPTLIQAVHADYLTAGADCLITATYQATFEGFRHIGLTDSAAADLLLLAVLLAVEARDGYWSHPKNRLGRLKPLVAASIGPYGAFLADGSEYSGDYGLSTAELIDWHRPRWQLLADSPAELLACETIPSFPEAMAYLHLLDEMPKEAWLTFSCRDGRHISDGSPLREVVRAVEKSPWVTGVGINCTAPRFIPDLIKNAQSETAKPLLVYPNSGEEYDPLTKSWTGSNNAESFGTAAREWRKMGAAGIGGCCRTTPAHILAISSRLKST